MKYLQKKLGTDEMMLQPVQLGGALMIDASK